jgi:hypothetical protein
MKKWILAGVALALALSLCACGSFSASSQSAAASSGSTVSDGSASSSSGAQSVASSSAEAENKTLRAENEALRKQLKAAETTSATKEDSNPIDTFFDNSGYGDEGTTSVLNYVAECYRNAWKAELNHLAKAVRDNLTYDEDRDLVEKYLKSVEDEVSSMDDMAPFVCGDTTVTPAERSATMGTIYGSLLENNGAAVYKNAFFQLMNVSSYSMEGGYEYVFNASAMKTEMDAALGK